MSTSGEDEYISRSVYESGNGTLNDLETGGKKKSKKKVSCKKRSKSAARSKRATNAPRHANGRFKKTSKSKRKKL
jgi:hypothetical protein